MAGLYDGLYWLSVGLKSYAVSSLIQPVLVLLLSWHPLHPGNHLIDRWYSIYSLFLSWTALRQHCSDVAGEREARKYIPLVTKETRTREWQWKELWSYFNLFFRKPIVTTSDLCLFLPIVLWHYMLIPAGTWMNVFQEEICETWARSPSRVRSISRGKYFVCISWTKRIFDQNIVFVNNSFLYWHFNSIEE